MLACPVRSFTLLKNAGSTFFSSLASNDALQKAVGSSAGLRRLRNAVVLANGVVPILPQPCPNADLQPLSAAQRAYLSTSAEGVLSSLNAQVINALMNEREDGHDEGLEDDADEGGAAPREAGNTIMERVSRLGAALWSSNSRLGSRLRSLSGADYRAIYKSIRKVDPGFSAFELEQKTGPAILKGVLGAYFRNDSADIAFIRENCSEKVQKILLSGLKERLDRDHNVFFDMYHLRDVQIKGVNREFNDITLSGVASAVYFLYDRGCSIVNGSRAGRDFYLESKLRFVKGKWLITDLQMSILNPKVVPSYM